MSFVQNLPNNGLSKLGTEKCHQQLETSSVYVAWHQTRPPQICKVNRLNHYERSLLLRKEMEKMHETKHKSCEPQNHQTRKRKRNALESYSFQDEHQPQIARVKKRKREHRPRREDDNIINDYLNDAFGFNDPKKQSLFDTLNVVPESN